MPHLRILGVFKIFRIHKLGMFIKNANYTEDIKSMLNLFKLTVYLCLWFHITACLWYSVCLINVDKQDDAGFIHTWYPPLDWLNYKESELFTD